jgi:ubiquinone/menaquinone biosynthesis C-methylase UbiE
MIFQAEDVRAAWDRIAAGFDQFVTAPGMPVAKDGLLRAGLTSGMRVLDVASGSGALSVPAARHGARVSAVDLSPNMIERLKARANREGLSNIDARVMDCHALDFPDETFDITASQFGVMLVPDQPQALDEMVRVTRTGGRVLMICLADPSEIEFLSIFIGAMRTAVPGFEGLPSDPPPLEFQVANPDVLRKRMVAAGLRDVRIETGAEELEIHAGKELWDWVTNSNPIGRMLVADLNDEQRLGVLQALDDAIDARSSDTAPAIVTNPVHFGIGTK